MKWRAEMRCGSGPVPPIRRSRIPQIFATLAAATLLAGCATTRPVTDGAVKIGKPYRVAGRTYVPRDDRHYDRTGFASWYGGAHHGRQTANGERFDMNAITAAHPTLPLPSYVEVTALETGRTILVRINDRGPFVDNRIIDLSRGSARALGIEKQGVARVRVRRVYPDEAQRAALARGRTVRTAEAPPPAPIAAPAVPVAPAAAPVPAPAMRAASSARYIQVAAFGDGDRADALASRLRDVAGSRVDAGDHLYRVRLGPFADDDAARSALAEVRRRGYQDAHIVLAFP